MSMLSSQPSRSVEPVLLRPDEVAVMLAIGMTKTRALIAERKIPSIRIGGSIRVPLDKLKEWIDRQMVKGQEVQNT